MASKEDDRFIPELIVDGKAGVSYKKGRFFGKGGFARCYEITDSKTNSTYAGKIVPKKILVGGNQKEKMTQEIAIHRSLKHQNIVGFHSFFEDNHNVYIVLELCRKRSMMELHKRRKILTEPEVRYFLHQILGGVQFLHKRNIIHRDLKLGNLFLNDDLTVKIGDFGLAARVEYQGERKRTLCGTPNYMAPEILAKKGHSFEVDVWSIGCIVYTLLFGKPPFETSSLRDTYSRIKRCQYQIPSPNNVSKEACAFIQSTLQTEPKMRPKVDELFQTDFMAGYTPKELPISCLTMAPRFTLDRPALRKPLVEVNVAEKAGGVLVTVTKQPAGTPLSAQTTAEECVANLKRLAKQLMEVLQKKPGKTGQNIFWDEMTDPAAQPIVWIAKWVDYSDKYGFGYQLSDDSVGIVFNDNTKLVMLADGVNVHYITKSGEESYHTMTDYPPTLEKKVKLLTYFRRYMSEHLLKAGASVAPRESDSLSRIPCMFHWCRTPSAVMMHLTNGTVQINFMNHTKIIMCPHMSAVTYIDQEKRFLTYRFATITDHGCSSQLGECLEFAYKNLPLLDGTKRV